MGAIVVHEFISLDGVFEDPKWTMEFGFDPKMGESLAAITGSAEALLLGRRTFEMFAPAWSTRTARDDPGAPFFNESHKYVVASQAPTAQWSNSSVLGPYRTDAIQKLKEQARGNLYVSGSGTLVRAMLRDGLIDELHLMVYPVLLGSGARLFEGSSTSVKLELAACEAYENGVLHLNYRPIG
jgi:dihydrofolate reductase